MKLVVVLALVVACGSNKPPLVGNRCDADVDCASTCVSGDAWPQGFCTFVCTVDAECGDNEYCVTIATGQQGSLCAISCGSDSDCDHLGSGYHCEQAARKMAVGTIGVCFGG